MDTYQFIAELAKIAASLAWPWALVAVASIVRDILADPPQPKETSDVRDRHPHPPAPDYPPR